MNTISFKTQAQEIDGFYIKTIQEVQQKLQTSHSAVTRIQAAATSAFIALRSTGFLLISPLYLPITFVVTLVRSNLKEATHNLKGNLAFTILSLQRAVVFPFATVIVLFSPNLYNRMIPSAMTADSSLPPSPPAAGAGRDAPPPTIGDLPPAPPPGAGPSAHPGIALLPPPPPSPAAPLLRTPADLDFTTIYGSKTPEAFLEGLKAGEEPSEEEKRLFIEAKALLRGAAVNIEKPYAAHLAIRVLGHIPDAGLQLDPNSQHLLQFAEACEKLYPNLALAAYQFLDGLELRQHLREGTYYKKTDQYEKALAYFTAMSMRDNPNPVAAFEAASLCHKAPTPLTKDLHAAIRLYEIAANGGYAPAKIVLVELDLEGATSIAPQADRTQLLQEVLIQDPSNEEALRLLRTLAERSDPTACCWLALKELENPLEGNFETKKAKAKALLEKTGGDPKARFHLALLATTDRNLTLPGSFKDQLLELLRGLNDPEAVALTAYLSRTPTLGAGPYHLRELALKTNPPISNLVERAALFRLALTQSLTVETAVITPAFYTALGRALWNIGLHHEGIIYWRFAAEFGDADAELYLGRLYAGDPTFRPRGRSFKDIALAERFLTPLAETSPVAQRLLGILETDVTRGGWRSERAVALFEKAAIQGDIIAHRYLAGIPHGWDPNRDLTHLEAAAAGGDAKAQLHLALQHEETNQYGSLVLLAGKALDPAKAVDLRAKAAAQGHTREREFHSWWVDD
ncbi:MAG: hypothetical protein JSR76_06660 [Verrucomicrobia bacterium]|nr:hypothetical protein [Verrucomicrobiota bacterium]